MEPPSLRGQAQPVKNHWNPGCNVECSAQFLSPINYHNSHAGVSAILVGQTLGQARIPFHHSFDEHLAMRSPSACKVPTLSDSEHLSNSQIASIRDFVVAGGGLIVAEQALHA